jgi:hypothetical protein
VTVGYTNARGAADDHSFWVVVSDHRLVNPGFEEAEPDPSGWSVTGAANVVTSGQHSGVRALQLTSPATATQRVMWLPFNTTFVVSGWGRAGARMTVRVGDVNAGTVTWTGSGWTEQAVRFTTSLCGGCPANGSSFAQGVLLEPVTVVLEDGNAGDGVPAYVDDLALTPAPTASAIRDLSVPRQQTNFSSTIPVWVGRIPPNARWEPAQARLTSSNPTVVPLSNLQLDQAEPAHPYAWRIRARGGGVAGQSDVTLTITDPASGLSTQRTFTVTVTP